MEVPKRSFVEGTPLDRWVNPATLRGAALIVVGAIILAFPDASAFLVALAIGIGLIVLGISDGWAAIRAPEGQLRSVAIGVGTVVAGVLMLFFVRETLRLLITIGGVFLALRGLLLVAVAVHRRGDHEAWVFDIVRGVLAVIVGGILVWVPESLVAATFIIGALVAIGAGAIIVAFGVSNDDELDLGSGELGGYALRWFRQRDVGDSMRADVVDALFFEEPDTVPKQVGFWTLLILSVVIATLGVLADSTAVVIGAMLVAPLMTPIMGVSAAIVNGWSDRMLRSFLTVVGGVIVAIAVAFIVTVWTPNLVPLSSNGQILSRTSPTLIDLMIAMAAGAAGAYATVDKRVSSSITGVAIAVALVPPLGVVGVMLQATRYGDALGAFLLFLTNLVSIIAVASVVFLLAGLAPWAEYRRNRVRMRTVYATVALGVFIVMIPLAFTSTGIIASATRQATTQDAVEDWLGDSDLELDRVAIDGEDVSVRISGEGEVPPVAVLEIALERRLGVDVIVRVEYFPSEVLVSDRR